MGDVAPGFAAYGPGDAKSVLPEGSKVGDHPLANRNRWSLAGRGDDLDAGRYLRSRPVVECGETIAPALFDRWTNRSFKTPEQCHTVGISERGAGCWGQCNFDL